MFEELKCIGCGKKPDELEEYVDAAREWGTTPDMYVMQGEGTFNRSNGHFACTECYVKMGMPTAPGIGWKAP